MPADLAFDRSERFTDQDGHLHVRSTFLSKACVNPYKGSEIPGWQELGLDPDKVYRLFRHPDELTKAAPTFNNLRLLSRHTAVDAANPKEDLVAGSTGSEARFEYPYIVNSLVVWRAQDIADVESREKLALYRENAVHMKYVEEVIKPNTCARLAVDYEMEPGKDIRYS